MLQRSKSNDMDILNGDGSSCNETRVTSTHDGNEVIGVEVERVSDVSEVVDKERTIAVLKMEPKVQMAPALRLYKRKKVVCSEPSLMASEPRSINDLPLEILLHILSHFGPEDLCLNIAKVCKQWNVLAKDVVLWKKLSYVCDVSSDISHIAEVLTVAPALHSLIIRVRNDVPRILEFLFHVCGYLRKLILKGCYLGEDSTGFLANIVALYPDLEVLSLESCYPLSPAGYCLIPRLKKLSELNLSYWIKWENSPPYCR